MPIFSFAPVPPLACAMCGVQCASESAFRYHNRHSKKHEENLILYDLKRLLNPSPFTGNTTTAYSKTFTYVFP